MSSAAIQLIVLAGVAVFLVLRLRSVLGTRDGFEPTADANPVPKANGEDRSFSVIEGGLDRDIYDHVEKDSTAGAALSQMKSVEPGFSVAEFLGGGRQAYEMILMAFERGELETLKQFLADDVYESFESVVFERADKGLSIEANFIGVRELKLTDASFHSETKLAEITLQMIGELTSVVKDADGEIVEGDANLAKRQKDSWTFARTMGSDDPNWQLVATGG